MDVPHIQIEQTQQDRHGLLLEPGNDEGQRQAVHIRVECLRQPNSYLNSRVGVVALAHIQETRDTTNVTEFLEANVRQEIYKGERRMVPEKCLLKRYLPQARVSTTVSLGVLRATSLK